MEKLFKMDPQVRDMVIHMILVEKIKSSRVLVARVTEAGHNSPITGKPYNPRSGANWLRRFDPDFKKPKPRIKTARVLDLQASLFEDNKPQEPPPTPTLAPPPKQVPPTPPIEQRVAIIVCPLSEIQNVVSEVCKKT